jgi:hypothetical protein
MYMMMFIVLLIFITGQRFVLSEPVVDKETKMRETLRIMSMRSSVYGLSYFITQAIFSLFTTLIVTLTFCMLRLFSPGEALLFFISLIFYGLSMIFKSMALSTLFSDSKVAGQIGSLVLIAPMALFMYLFSLVLTHKNPNLMYIGYMIPYVPTMVILGNTLDVEPYVELNMAISWAALILSLPAYYGLYVYLDQVMPNTFGIRKSCCFCLRRRRDQDV